MKERERRRQNREQRLSLVVKTCENKKNLHQRCFVIQFRKTKVNPPLKVVKSTLYITFYMLHKIRFIFFSRGTAAFNTELYTAPSPSKMAEFRILIFKQRSDNN